MFSFVLQMCKNVQETKQKTKAKTKTEEKNQKKKKNQKKIPPHSHSVTFIESEGATKVT